MDKISMEIKLAELRVLKDIVNADMVVRQRELDYLQNVAQELGVSQQELDQVDQMATLKALAIIRELPVEEKVKFAKRMGHMIVVDEDINYNEVTLYNEVCDVCDISVEFCVEDYPSYTLSGNLYC